MSLSWWNVHIPCYSGSNLSLTLKSLEGIFLGYLLIVSWRVNRIVEGFFFFFGTWRGKWNLTDKLMENTYASKTSYLQAMFKLIACYVCCDRTKPRRRVTLNILILVFRIIIKKLICFNIMHSMIHKVWYFAIQALPKSSDAASQ